MKKIKIGITGCLGRMGQELIKATNKDKRMLISSLTESKNMTKKLIIYQFKITLLKLSKIQM